MSSPDHGSPTTYRLHLVAPFDLTSRLADRLAQMDEIDPPAISTHDTSDPSIWALDAYYQTQPDINEITSFLEVAVSPLPSIDITQMNDEDWVALVQSGLSPIRAGRYFIYGSHDREHASRQAGDIEIDAGQALAPLITAPQKAACLPSIICSSPVNSTMCLILAPAPDYWLLPAPEYYAAVYLPAILTPLAFASPRRTPL